MILNASMSERIIIESHNYLGFEFNYEKFNCVHFAREVYRCVGITLPLLDRKGFPPKDFHLSPEEFGNMPTGHCAFFKRKACSSGRIWTHVAIIVSSTELIHCSRYFGCKVVITPRDMFLEIYDLAPQIL